MSIFTSTLAVQAARTFRDAARDAGWESIDTWVSNDDRAIAVRMTTTLERLIDSGFPILPRAAIKTKMVGRYRLRVTRLGFEK